MKKRQLACATTEKKIDSMFYHGKKTVTMCYHGKRQLACVITKKKKQHVLSRKKDR